MLKIVVYSKIASVPVYQRKYKWFLGFPTIFLSRWKIDVACHPTECIHPEVGALEIGECTDCPRSSITVEANGKWAVIISPPYRHLVDFYGKCR